MPALIKVVSKERDKSLELDDSSPFGPIETLTSQNASRDSVKYKTIETSFRKSYAMSWVPYLYIYIYIYI
jgi:hypothetical protein